MTLPAKALPGFYLRNVLLSFAIGTFCAAQQPAGFDGTWVLRQDGENILKLTLIVKDGQTSGSLAIPKNLKFDRDGRIRAFGPGHITGAIESAERRPDPKQPTLELAMSGGMGVMILKDKDHATLGFAGLPWPLKLERVLEGASIILATSLKEPDQAEYIRRLRPEPPKQDGSARVALDRQYPPEIVRLRGQLRTMVDADQDARLAFDNTRMQAIDENNRDEVVRIFERYGWVTNSLAGRDAAHDFWLLAQHQTPAIQRRLLPSLEKAAKSGDAAMMDYVYLYDRVKIGLGQPQRWGSQIKCVDGKPALYPVDDPGSLDARRKELSLVPIDDYLKADPLANACAQFAK